MRRDMLTVDKGNKWQLVMESTHVLFSLSTAMFLRITRKAIDCRPSKQVAFALHTVIRRRHTASAALACPSQCVCESLSRRTMFFSSETRLDSTCRLERDRFGSQAGDLSLSAFYMVCVWHSCRNERY